MTKYIFISLLFFGLFSACKSTSTVANHTALKTLSPQQITQNIERALVQAKTISAKIKVKFTAAKSKQVITANLRIEKDSVIWISLTAIGGIPVAKMLITPHRVSYYEKLNNTYFDGDFSLLNSWLKADLNFDKIQNILFAQPAESIDNIDFILSISDRSYELKAKNKIDKNTAEYWVNSENFKLNKQQFSKNKKEFLAFSYLGFDTTTAVIFPNKMTVEAKNEKESIKVDLTYNSLKFDLPLSYPFKIPKGYKMLDIK